MSIEQISVADLHALGPDITLIDVREDYEWAEARIAYARHVPLGTVPDRLSEFDGQPTYVLCKVGGRSQSACAFAAAHGHDVVNVTGGILAWLEAGHPVERGADV
ncbi:MAG: rhodanese-like domain-containing protein [Ilumatobacter sp.]